MKVKLTFDAGPVMEYDDIIEVRFDGNRIELIRLDIITHTSDCDIQVTEGQDHDRA